MDNHYHERKRNIDLLGAQIELVIDCLSTHSERFMQLSKKVYETHFENMVQGLELIGEIACDIETKSHSLSMLDNIRAWNVLVEQVSETLVDISQDLVAIYDATARWAATESHREMLIKEAMENARETKVL